MRIIITKTKDDVTVSVDGELEDISDNLEKLQKLFETLFPAPRPVVVTPYYPYTGTVIPQQQQQWPKQNPSITWTVGNDTKGTVGSGG